MKEILTKHFHIHQNWQHLICYFEIMMPNGKYIMWEFINHKLHQKDIWKL